MFSCGFWERSWNVPDVFWVMATAFVTLLLAIITVGLICVARKQLRDLAQTSRADFIFRLKNDFFTEGTRRLLFLVEENLLRFQDDKILYFTILRSDPDYPNLHHRLDELGIKDSTVSTYLIDDLLLGLLEDVSVFLARERIDEKDAYDMFYTYVKICAKNLEIQKYIAAIRSEPGDENIYSGFDKLYKRLSATTKN